MAKELKQIFTPSDKVEQTFTINAWHVSQSVDALTGEEDYDITISGSLTVTGSISHNLIPNANGAAASVLVRDDVTGEYKITGSYSVDYVDTVSLNGTDLEFTGVGDGFDGDVDLSSLTGSTDYVDTVSLNGTDLEFTGVGDAFTGSVDLSSLTGSTDYVSNVTLNTLTSELEFTGVGNGFDGDIDLSRFNDNGGGFTFRYSGSVKLNQTGSGGDPNKVISTAASHLTASGANEWHFSDIGRSFSSQFNYDPAKNIFCLITASVQNDEDILVRVYDDKNPRYQAYYTNVGPATIENVSGNGGDLVMDLEWVGGTGFGDLSGIAFNFPNGTNPNNTNVSFAFIGGGSGGGSTTPGGSDTQVQFNDGGAFEGSSGLTFNDTTQTLTVNSTLTNPTLKLVADGPPVGFAAGRVLADIQGETTTGLNAGNLQFALDQGAYSPTSLPTTFTIKTTPNGTVTPTSKLTIFNNGKTQLNQYGSGTFTGTATKWLAVDSSGNVIEENPPSGGGSTDYVSDVTLNGTDLEFTGTGNAFNNDVDLSPLLTSNANVRTEFLNGNQTINSLSTPNLTDTNNGRVIVFPQNNTSTLTIGFAAGAPGPSSWDENYQTTIYNTGIGNLDTSDQNEKFKIALVTPNDGGGDFQVVMIGENGAGNDQFGSALIAAGNGTSGVTDLDFELHDQGMVDIMLDYTNRKIVLWGKSCTIS